MSVLHAPDRRAGNCIGLLSNTVLLLSTDIKLLVLFQYHVERCCVLANKTSQQLYKVATPCINDHQFKDEEMGSVRELSRVSSQIVLKCLYLARVGRLDIL